LTLSNDTPHAPPPTRTCGAVALRLRARLNPALDLAEKQRQLERSCILTWGVYREFVERCRHKLRAPPRWPLLRNAAGHRRGSAHFVTAALHKLCIYAPS